MGNKRTLRFSEVQATEKKLIARQRKNRDDNENRKLYTGLAISGGGIRSASFGLGVIQALQQKGWLKKLDYLSTASGGGYIGTSLTWFNELHKNNGGFAFASNEQGARHESGDTDDGFDSSDVNFIRQHANYLAPSSYLNTISLLGVILRGMLVSFSIYFSLLLALMIVIDAHQLLEKAMRYPDTLLGIFVLTSFIYALSTFLFTRNSILIYRGRTFVQCLQGILLLLAFVTALLASLPYALRLITWLRMDVLPVASTSTVLGIAGTLFQYFKQQKASKNSMFSTLRISLTAGLLIYGLLLLALHLAMQINAIQQTLEGFIAAAAFGLLFGLLVNLNYLGLSRMYRDRLMETFLPNPVNVKKNEWGLATRADRYKLSQANGEDTVGPYHLINATVILVDSKKVKYRDRGGDNFLLSHLYCGSDATRWVATRNFDNNGMTLATAMAISGAAVNPNAGYSGGGATRNRLVSFLMVLLNLRLGYWAANPYAADIRGLTASLLKPNFIYPGLRQGLLGRRLDTRAGYVQLADGGGFENTAIYELIRRRVDLIFLSEAGGDPDYTFSDIANASEKVRVDFGVEIVFDKDFGPEGMIPGSSNAGKNLVEKYAFAERGFAIARVEYPKSDREPAKTGLLIMIKATMIEDVPVDVLAYKSFDDTFPNQSTTRQQFFDERQLESYRALAVALTDGFFSANEKQNWLPEI